MKFDSMGSFKVLVARDKVRGSQPLCTYLVDFGWDDWKWWRSQEVFDDLDRYDVVSRHIGELHKIIYHTVCFPGRVLRGKCADVTLCCPHIVPLAAILLLLHQAEQEWRFLLRKINLPFLSTFFLEWKVIKSKSFDFQ
jgi:hypothetical protein